MKNVCQTCILDLVYGLPVQVRDSFLAKHDPHALVVPESAIGREYHAMQQLKAANEQRCGWFMAGVSEYSAQEQFPYDATADAAAIEAASVSSV